MKTIKFIFSAMIILLMANSCQKKISFDAELISSRLVVNGMIEPDNIVDLLVAASKPIPGVVSDFNWIIDANVVLYENGEKIETLDTYDITYDETKVQSYWYGNSAEKRPAKGYRSKHKVVAGNSYKIVVSHPEYDEVTCETVVPEPVPIESIDTSTFVSNKFGYEQNMLNLKITFNDPLEEDNYYRIIAVNTIGQPSVEYHSDKEQDTVVYVTENNMIINDPIINPEQEDANDILFSGPSNVYQVFTDELIQGKTYTINFDVNLYNNWNSELENVDDLGAFYQFKLIFQSLSREAYLYIKSSYEHKYYDGELFVEPVQVFSNVEGGIGILGAQASTVFEIKHGEYPKDNIEYREGYNSYGNNYYSPYY